MTARNTYLGKPAEIEVTVVVRPGEQARRAAQEIIRAYVLWLAEQKKIEQCVQQGLPLTPEQQYRLDLQNKLKADDQKREEADAKRRQRKAEREAKKKVKA